MIDPNKKKDLQLNAKSLGNSLGTGGKPKTLNDSQNPLVMMGIDRDQSTLNDGQFFTLAKTGLLNNLNLSQLIRSQNILEEDGIEDLHFYFVSFHNHKAKLLYNQELRLRKQSKQKQAKAKKAKEEAQRTISSLADGDWDFWNAG